MIDPEDMETQIVLMQRQIYALEQTLCHLIAWSSRELGEMGCHQLLDMLNKGFIEEARTFHGKPVP